MFFMKPFTSRSGLELSIAEFKLILQATQTNKQMGNRTKWTPVPHRASGVHRGAPTEESPPLMWKRIWRGAQKQRTLLYLCWTCWSCQTSQEQELILVTHRTWEVLLSRGLMGQLAQPCVGYGEGRGSNAGATVRRGHQVVNMATEA